MSLYPHRIVATIGRTSTMPIQCLSRSCDAKYLIGTSTTQETVQLIDGLKLKQMIDKKKKQGAKKQNNSFFADLEGDHDKKDAVNQLEQSSNEAGQSHNDDDNSDDDSDDDSDDEFRKPPKKKKKKTRL